MLQFLKGLKPLILFEKSTKVLIICMLLESAEVRAGTGCIFFGALIDPTLILVLIFAVPFFGYLLVYKPEWVALLLFLLMITNINIDLPGMPMNSRALITLALFGRIMFDRERIRNYPSFIRQGAVVLLFIFMFYILIISYWQDLLNADLIKICMSTVISSFCVYHYYFHFRDPKVIKWAMLIGGLSCFGDLAFTYAKFGSFPVRRLYILVTGGQFEELEPGKMLMGMTNHNFFGQICGMAFIYAITDYIKNKATRNWMLVMLPLMFLGVLMSTSRSSLMAIFLVVFIMIASSMRYNFQRKKVMKIFSFSAIAVIVGILVFSNIQMYFNLDSKFVDEVVFRLAEEPIAIIQKAMGQNYNINNLGSMDWREEAAAHAYAEYMKLPLIEQLFGIGFGGFIARNLGDGLNPHNGILLILIQYGVVGFLLYLTLIITVLYNTVRLKNISPALGVMLFILFYGVGQNDELTAASTLLFVFTVVAETADIQEKENETAAALRKAKRDKRQNRNQLIPVTS